MCACVNIRVTHGWVVIDINLGFSYNQADTVMSAYKISNTINCSEEKAEKRDTQRKIKNDLNYEAYCMCTSLLTYRTYLSFIYDAQHTRNFTAGSRYLEKEIFLGFPNKS